MNNATSKKTSGKRFFNILRLLGIVLFAIILLRIDLKAVGAALLTTDQGLLLWGIIFQLLVLVSKGIRWHIMNDNRREKRFWELSLGRFYESYAIGVVTPGRMGDLMKAGHEEGKNNILSTGLRVLAERGIDIAIFSGLAGLAVLSGYYSGMRPVFGWIVIAGSSLAMIISVMLLISRSFIRLINRLLIVLPGRFKHMEIEGRSYKPVTTFLILLLSFISNLSYFVSCYYLGKAAGLDAGFIWISGAVAVSGLINMLPVTIMGLGTRELTFLYAFQAFNPEMAIAFSFLVVLVAQIGGGFISLFAGQYLLFRTRKYNYD